MALSRGIHFHFPNISQAFSRAMRGMYQRSARFFSRSMDATWELLIDVHNATENLYNWDNAREVNSNYGLWSGCAFWIGRFFHTFATNAVAHIIYDGILDLERLAIFSYYLTFSIPEGKRLPDDNRTPLRWIFGIPGKILGLGILVLPAAIDLVLGLNALAYQKTKNYHKRMKKRFFGDDSSSSESDSTEGLDESDDLEWYRPGILGYAVLTFDFLGMMAIKAGQQAWQGLKRLGGWTAYYLKKLWQGAVCLAVGIAFCAEKIWQGIKWVSGWALKITQWVTGLYKEGIEKTTDYYHALGEFFFADKSFPRLAENLSFLRPGILGGLFLLGSLSVMTFGWVSGLNSLAFQKIGYALRNIYRFYFGGEKDVNDPAKDISRWRLGALGVLVTGGAVIGLGIARVGVAVWDATVWSLKKLWQGAVCLATGIAFCAEKIWQGIKWASGWALKITQWVTGLYKEGIDKTTDYNHGLLEFFFADKPFPRLAENLSFLRPGIFGGLFLLGSLSVMSFKWVSGFNIPAFQKIGYAVKNIYHFYFGGESDPNDSAKDISRWRLGALGIIVTSVVTVGLSVAWLSKWAINIGKWTTGEGILNTLQYNKGITDFFFKPRDESAPRRSLRSLGIRGIFAGVLEGVADLITVVRRTGLVGSAFLLEMSIARGLQFVSGLNDPAFLKMDYMIQKEKHKLYGGDENWGQNHAGKNLSLWRLGLVGAGVVLIAKVAFRAHIASLWCLEKLCQGIVWLGGWAINIGKWTTGLYKEGIAKTRDYYHALREFFLGDDKSAREANAKWYHALRPGLVGGAFLLGSAVVMAIGAFTGLHKRGLQRTMYDLRWVKHQLFGGVWNDEDSAHKIGWRRPSAIGGAVVLIGSLALGFAWLAQKAWQGTKLGLKCLGFSSYTYHDIKLTLKISANGLFNRNFDVAPHLYALKKIKEANTLDSKCSQISLVGKLTKGIVVVGTVIMAGIGFSATNWHRFGLWIANQRNEGRREKDETTDDTEYSKKKYEYIDSSEHEAFLKEAHSKTLGYALSRYNLIRFAAHALKFTGIIGLAGVGIGIRIGYNVLKLLFTPVTKFLKWCCCPAPSIPKELGDVIQNLHRFQDRLTFDGHLPNYANAKKLKQELKKSQPGREYKEDELVKEMREAYENEVLAPTSNLQRIGYWFKKEFRLALNFGGLDTIEEKIIDKFTEEAEEYAREEQQNASVKGFLQNRYQALTKSVKDGCVREKDKVKVQRTAYVLRALILEKHMKEDMPEWRAFNDKAAYPDAPLPSAPPYDLDEIDIAKVYSDEAKEGEYRQQFGDPSAPPALEDAVVMNVNEVPEGQSDVVMHQEGVPEPSAPFDEGMPVPSAPSEGELGEERREEFMEPQKEEFVDVVSIPAIAEKSSIQDEEMEPIIPHALSFSLRL